MLMLLVKLAGYWACFLVQIVAPMIVLLNQHVAAEFALSSAAAGVMARSMGKLKARRSLAVSQSSMVRDMFWNCGTNGFGCADIM